MVVCYVFFLFMLRRTPRSSRTTSLFPHSTLFPSLGFFPRHVHLARLVHPGGGQQRVVLLAKVVERRVAADLETEMEVDTACREPVDADRQSPRLNSSH